MKYALTVAATFLLVGAAIHAQQPTFRVQVEAIELDAIVTDASGKPVTGLSPNDFQILEDGKPQVITSFSQVDIPFEPRTEPLDAKHAAIEPDVAGNDHSDGRVYMFLLDEVSPAYALRARIFLKDFIGKHFAANDRGAVIFLGHQDTGAAQLFTNSPRLLLAAIEKYTGSITGESTASAGGNGSGGAADNTSSDAARFAQLAQARIDEVSTMSGLQSVAEMMAKLHGRRKSVLFFSSGLPESIFRAINYQGGVMTTAEQYAHAAVMAATRGNVTFYPINPAGLQTGMQDGGNGAAPAQDVTSDDPEVNGLAGLNSRQSLSMLAQTTGGFALINSNSMSAAFDRIVTENSSYYLLGYTSTNDKRDGQPRGLTVRVTRPGLQVRARSGYIAPTENEKTLAPARATALSAAVSEGVTSPLADGTAVGIRLFAAPYRRETKDALVAIAAEVDPAGLALVERDKTFTGKLEVGFLAIDPKGKVYSGEHYTIDLALKPDTYETAKQQGLRVLSEIHLPPGRYQLHLAAGSPWGTAGNVVYDLTVPNFTKDPLMLSGIALTSTSTSGAATVSPKKGLTGLLPHPATAMREFGAGDTLTLFGEVYENGKAAGQSIDVRVELRAENGRVVASADGRDTPFTLALPLAKVAEGNYVINVEARSRIGAQTASHAIPIRVTSH